MIPSGHDNQTTCKMILPMSMRTMYGSCRSTGCMERELLNELAFPSLSVRAIGVAHFHNTMLWKLNQLTNALLILVVFVMNQP